ncbi:conserved Plasmodium protein, unknown function [Plasmodium knowlesi strain H]|uniref:Uncharacterized protein n=3 Tax=Plasmodium knowlesi TaxID=5850 RepID=A0A5E7X5Z2_PLAKH|nr:conserved Plasmodium protein, unknown function [Plasmodium knowlesi strain H]OTN67773.1 Uncharacterized protein PKNOH_S05393000 [Plasmodium knowlesi]CAA9990517.1 conserved Plasmodium protein, unknown function [Plasmodium knowlesi strain H]SBO19757.1 conserved Plasmodium protein, unknown function [Plasmodium knowlesi strain H]SBO22444.1 conserved Plasmodium protein, unknown function [Plasmodium knowlesi strain H]VVS79991.1 conserved Plasmodium protein, unknown function [Plasmodium knowlesi s
MALRISTRSCTWHHLLASYKGPSVNSFKHRGIPFVHCLRTLTSVNKQIAGKTHVNYFISQEKSALSTSSNVQLNEGNSEDYQSDGESDRLVLNDNDEDESDEGEDLQVEVGTAIGVTKQGITTEGEVDRKVGCTHLGGNIPTHEQSCGSQSNNETAHLRKRNKYDPDTVVMYNDVTELPPNMCTPLLSEEEIEQVNSGGGESSLEKYSCTVVYGKKMRS